MRKNFSFELALHVHDTLSSSYYQYLRKKKKEKYTQKKTDKGREEQPKKLSLQCLVRSCCFQ